MKKRNMKDYSIENGVLYGLNKNITVLEVPEGVREIAPAAFEYANYLYTVTLPKSLQSIGKNAFWGCTHLCEIVNRSSLDLSADRWSSNGGIAAWALSIVKDESERKCRVEDNLVTLTLNEERIAVVYLGNKKKLALKNGITELQIECFASSKIQEIALPASLRRVGDKAFYCSDLHSVTIPENVFYLGARAFDCCEYLTDVSILNPQITLGVEVFDHTYELRSIFFAGSRKEWEDLIEEQPFSSPVTITYGKE